LDIIYAIIFGAIYYGIRKILRDWRERYEQLDKQRHERDLQERDRGDVVDLAPDKDGVFRPDDEDK
jgi:hypothetical protein